MHVCRPRETRSYHRHRRWHVPAPALAYPVPSPLRLTTAERPPPGYTAFFTERHLQAVWFDPAFRPACLFTLHGESVEVTAPGRWNLEAGPDFIDAVLRIGPNHRELRGDVEIHIRPGDWRAHRHRGDPRYRSIVAHVTFYPGPLPADELPDGAVLIALRDTLRSDPAFAFENIDLTAYPFAVRDDQPRCARALSHSTPDAIAALLEAAGLERIRRRIQLFQEADTTATRNQLLYEELMAALGYKNNKVTFRVLARRLPLLELRAQTGGDTEKAYALLCGVAGLLPEKLSKTWDQATHDAVRHWWDHWWKMRTRWSSAILPRETWVLAGQRPINHPQRRLMAAAILFGGQTALPDRLSSIDVERESWLSDSADLFKAADHANYWQSRLGLGGKPQPVPTALLGPDRIATIVTNVIAPWLMARAGIAENSMPARLARLEPEADNAVTRQMAFNLLGHDHNPSLYRSALRQQGLIHLFYEFCLNARSGCATCRLPDAIAT